MKKTLKKLLSLSLAVILAFGLIACSSDVVKDDVVTNDPDLERIVAEEGQAYEEAFENSFSQSSGLTCECKFYAKGTSLITDCIINGVDDVPEDVKAQMQETYDNSKASLKASFDPIKDEAPNLTNAIINVCEEDGDIIASVDIAF